MQTPTETDSLRREIIILLLLKAVLIYALWVIFFSRPLDKTLTADTVAAAFLDSGTAPPSSQPSIQEAGQ